MRTLAVLLAACVLAGCASSGTKVDPAQVAAFREGHTTKKEVVAALGAPSMAMPNPSGNGGADFYYTHSQVQFKPETFIPIVGLFAGGMNSSTSTSIFRFNSAGVLTSMQVNNPMAGVE